MVGRKFFERLSKTEKTPKWQVAAFHCWANIDRRGHCPMPRGKLTELVGTPNDRETRRVVNEAVSRGWLEQGSNDRCMIAPHDMKYDAGNYKLRAECEFH